MSICLLTDFGTKDAYVGTLKGVIQQINPKVSVLDLSHDVAPFNILQAAWILSQNYRYFPKKTIFIAVVDPGVGSKRLGLLIETKDYFFVGPDNGIFTGIFQQEKIKYILHLNQKKYFLKNPSSTFHGRDIFAPVAAHLSKGISSRCFGEKISTYTSLPHYLPRRMKNFIEGQVLSIDHFGNIITNLSKEILSSFPTSSFHLKIGNKILHHFVASYYEAPQKMPVFLIGSSGLIEIAFNGGSAQNYFKIKVGAKVTLSGSS
ncbi:MAG: SAM-dependent chlorinase/fluorinase [Deltaproteobacteria bacterium]|nr:SAM-dependent chlorinase/fluorinase [Deltaproteobacteria bacterium]